LIHANITKGFQTVGSLRN